MPATENEKRVAVTLDAVLISGPLALPNPSVAPLHSRINAQLIVLQENQSLAEIVDNLCQGWKVDNPKDFALQFEQKQHVFVSEKSRSEIRNGSILSLTFSPAKTAKLIIDQFSSKGAEKLPAASKRLCELSMDVTFAKEFIALNGLSILTNLVQSGSELEMTVAHTLRSIVDLMDHGIVSWDVLEPSFIKTVGNFVSTTGSSQVDATTLQASLEILQSIVLYSKKKYELVEREVTAQNLSQHLDSSNQEIQKNSIALINALFMTGDTNKKARIAEHLRCRKETLRKIIRSDLQNPEMCHEIYVLQTLLFSVREVKMKTPVDPNNQSVLKCITELRKIAFDTDFESSRKQNHTKDFQKLGFTNTANPAEDLKQIPPGILALENMNYFAKMHGGSYCKVVLENSSRADNHDLPFARASIDLTSIICKILKIGEPPSEEGRDFYPLFFFHEKPFEEFYCQAIQLMNKTWKEMKATRHDFSKVLNVVRDQLLRAMSGKPQSFDELRTRLNSFNYTRMVELWDEERQRKEEYESQAKPIVELREQLKPEIIDLIKEQRLNFLVGGTTFTQRVGRARERKRYCRLSPNHKVLYYGDVEDQSLIPTIEQLPNKIPVVDMTGLLTGKECPHMRRDKQGLHQLAFSVQTIDPDEDPLLLIAPCPRHFSIWTDGINALLGNPMVSDLAKEELDILLRMEVKLRLLDLEGEEIPIPDSPPPIPAEPDNFDFCME